MPLAFVLRTPDTPKQKEIFANLPAYKVASVVVNGRKFYVYKDEAKGMALVGGEAEYQRYRELARQERESADYETAMMANAAEAASWRGAAGSDWWRLNRDRASRPRSEHDRDSMKSR